jgi:hypothetical protein
MEKGSRMKIVHVHWGLYPRSRYKKTGWEALGMLPWLQSPAHTDKKIRIGASMQ